MKYLRVVVASCLLLFPFAAYASDGLWTAVNRAERASMAEQQSFGQMYRLDVPTLKQRLSRAGFEGRASINSEIELPVAGGQIQRFSLQESPIMAAELAARYPDIKTYKIHGIDNPYASGRLSISPKGFHGMITDPSGTFYIDPQDSGEYRAARKDSHMPAQLFNCGVEGHDHQTPVSAAASRASLRTAGSLRIYRLAVAATAEYVAAVGGSKTLAMSEVTNAINRVNQIYERDLGIRLELVANNDALLYDGSPDSDPYANTNLSLMLEQNQNIIDSVIESKNYDIGHVFGTSGGGLAEVGSVCTASKAGGVTGLSSPSGEHFYIDFVAHEIGHQFSAEHTFNGTSENCFGDNRIQESAFEPGSGSTIMSYVGICGAENIGTSADAMFHAGSVAKVDNFTTTGTGAECGLLESINNPSDPSADAGNDFTIPRKTPFIMTATASDSDGDSLTYSWDQMDAGTQTSATTLGFDLGDNSLFRSYLPQSYLPQSVNERHFPALGTTMLNKYDVAETLACKTRNLNFRLTVRDGKSGIGRDDVVISVDANSGPFVITSHTSPQTISSNTQQVSWSVAKTHIAPVSCSQVDISLLTFNSGKTSYSETPLAAGVANDGLATVSIPEGSSAKARFKVQCTDNIFYDISDVDLVITGSGVFPSSEKVVSYNPDANLTQSSTPVEVCVEGGTPVTPIDPVDPVDPVGTDSPASSGGGSFNIYWLLSLLSGLFLRKRFEIRA